MSLVLTSVLLPHNIAELASIVHQTDRNGTPKHFKPQPSAEFTNIARAQTDSALPAARPKVTAYSFNSIVKISHLVRGNAGLCWIHPTVLQLHHWYPHNQLGG